MRRPLGRKAALGLLLLLILSLVFQLRVLDEKFLLGDEGIALMGGWRVSQGEIPHRDFFEIIPPVSFLPTAVVFGLFGVGVLQARLLVLAYSLLLLGLVDRVLLRLEVSVWGRAFALAFLTPFGVFYWPVPSHHWVADLFLLGALLALLESVGNGGGRRVAGYAALAGVCTALCGLTLQDQGGYLALGTLVLVLPWIPAAAGLRRRVALGWAAGLTAVAGVAAAVLVPLVGIDAIFYQWILFPATRYKNISTNATGAFTGWDTVAGLWSGSAFSSRPLFVVALTLCTFFLLLLPVGTGGSLLWLSRVDRTGRGAQRILAAGSLACVGAAAHRWALTNMVWAAPALLLPLVWALDRATRSGERSLRALGKGSLVTVGGGALIFASAYYSGTYSLPSARLQTPAGSLRSGRIDEVRAVQETLDAIGALVPPGVPLFCNGYTPLLNFLSLHPNPTRYQFFFQPGYHTEAQAEDVVASLRAAPEAWVLLAKPVQPSFSLEAFVVANYDVAWQNGRTVLFRRRAAPPPDQRGESPTTATAR